MSENEAKKTISLWKNSNSEFIARVDRKTGKAQRLAHHANHVSALMALYTDWPEMAHAMNLIGALHDVGKLDPRFCAAIDQLNRQTDFISACLFLTKKCYPQKFPNPDVTLKLRNCNHFLHLHLHTDSVTKNKK